MTASPDEALARWVAGIDYKPGWTFRVDEEPDGPYLSATVAVADARVAGRDTTVTGRVPLGPASRSDPGAFRHRVKALIEHLELHEVGEWLTFDGERTFDPHR